MSATAIFAGPDDGETCDGCSDAVTGNPYTINTCPEPGEFECMARCRHFIQLAEDAPDDVPTVTWSANIGFETDNTVYYQDRTPDQDLERNQVISLGNVADVPFFALEDAGIDTAVQGPIFAEMGAGLSAILDGIEATGALNEDGYAALAQYAWSNGLDVDALGATLGLNAKQLDTLWDHYNDVLTNAVTKEMAVQLLQGGMDTQLTVLLDANPTFRTILEELADQGFAYNQSDMAMVLSKVLDRDTFYNSDTQRWMFKETQASPAFRMKD